jgi:hypothetical protein
MPINLVSKSYKFVHPILNQRIAKRQKKCLFFEDTDACNSNCHCESVPVSRASLVCSLEDTTGILFKSPCHAGCNGPPRASAFANCSCLAAGTARTAVLGPCPQSSTCRTNSILYIAILVVGAALLAAGPAGQSKLLFMLRSLQTRSAQNR